MSYVWANTPAQETLMVFAPVPAEFYPPSEYGIFTEVRLNFPETLSEVDTWKV
jgi:hypothetical protein